MIIPNTDEFYNSYFHKYKNINILVFFSQILLRSGLFLTNISRYRYHRTVKISLNDKKTIRFMYKII